MNKTEEEPTSPNGATATATPVVAAGDSGNPLELLRAEAAKQAKATAGFDRALAELAKRAARLEASPREVLEAIEKARQALLLLAPCPDPAALLESLEAQAKGAVDRAARRFGTALAAALREKLGSEVELRPLENGYELGGCHIRSDAATGRVAIEFARVEVLKNLAADPEAVASALAKFLTELEKPPLDPDRFLEQMAAAYGETLRATGKPSGESVDILEFWRRLVLELQPDAFRRDPTGRRFRDYPLYRLAHDIWRLRAARRFEVKGRRLELQTAVHDRAYGKALWIPGEKSGGAFYQAIAFK